MQCRSVVEYHVLWQTMQRGAVFLCSHRSAVHDKCAVACCRCKCQCSVSFLDEGVVCTRNLVGEGKRHSVLGHDGAVVGTYGYGMACRYVGIGCQCTAVEVDGIGIVTQCALVGSVHLSKCIYAEIASIDVD